MKQLKIKLHSVVDLITNSSTVLFTDSSKSVDALKDVMNEFLKIYNINEKVEDIFDISLTVDDLDEHMHDYITDNPEEFDLKDDDTLFENAIDLVDKYMEGMKLGKIDTPEWVTDLSANARTNWIVIKSKDKKHEHLAELFNTLIYSVEVDEQYE